MNMLFLGLASNSNEDGDFDLAAGFDATPNLDSVLNYIPDFDQTTEEPTY